MSADRDDPSSLLLLDGSMGHELKARGLSQQGAKAVLVATGLPKPQLLGPPGLVVHRRDVKFWPKTPKTPAPAPTAG